MAIPIRTIVLKVLASSRLVEYRIVKTTSFKKISKADNPKVIKLKFNRVWFRPHSAGLGCKINSREAMRIVTSAKKVGVLF